MKKETNSNSANKFSKTSEEKDIIIEGIYCRARRNKSRHYNLYHYIE
jgi:hypothetical protein